MFIVDCLLKNKFNIHITCIILFTYLSQHCKAKFPRKEYNLIKLFTINYSLFKFNYNWRHYSAIPLTVVMLCVCTRRVCVKFTTLVCKAVRMAFSCQTSAISFPFIPIPWFNLPLVNLEMSNTTIFKSNFLFSSASYKLCRNSFRAINLLKGMTDNIY